jgi:hypothetical protein
LAALSLLFRRLHIFIYLREQHPFTLIKPVLACKDCKK